VFFVELVVEVSTGVKIQFDTGCPTEFVTHSYHTMSKIFQAFRDKGTRTYEFARARGSRKITKDHHEAINVMRINTDSWYAIEKQKTD
jgi:hypothetical protein